MGVWSTIKFTDLSGINRIDGEYFDQKYLELERKLNQNKLVPITSLVNVSDGNHMSISKYFTNDFDSVPYYRGQDINDFFLENAEPYRIKNEAFEKGWMKRSYFLPGDVLLSIVGTVGSLSIVPETITKSTGSCKIAILRPKSDVDPNFISAFLLSKYGQFQIKRNVRGAVQTGLILKDMVLLKVPIIDKAEMNDIASKIREAIILNHKSKSFYTQAIQLLEQELGLDKISFEKHRNFIAYNSEVATSRRMNAEFYSPVVKNILSSDFLSNSKPLSSLFQIERGTTPKSYLESGIPVLKTKNIRIPEIDRSRIQDYVDNSKDLTTIQENDLLLASMGVGSLGRMSFIENLDHEYVVDGTIRVLRRKPETSINYEVPTLLFLTSRVGQELIYRGIVGSTGIISLPDDFLAKIPIPEFKPDLREKLTLLVKDSMQANRESKNLLEQGKTRVEELIEQSIEANA